MLNVTEWNNGNTKEIFKNNGMYQGGLKEAIQAFGEYLRKNGNSLNIVITQLCIKRNRKNNPIHKWPLDEYLIGVPLKK